MIPRALSSADLPVLIQAKVSVCYHRLLQAITRVRFQVGVPAHIQMLFLQQFRARAQIYCPVTLLICSQMKVKMLQARCQPGLLVTVPHLFLPFCPMPLKAPSSTLPGPVPSTSPSSLPTSSPSASPSSAPLSAPDATPSSNISLRLSLAAPPVAPQVHRRRQPRLRP